jgi:SMC interacting uncharacterized protein involved in chromosome segregation
MSILKYAAGVPVVAAVVASLYGGLSYVNALQNTIELNEKTIITMELTIQANNDKINMRLDNEVSGIMTWGNGSFENNNIRISNVEGEMTRAREDLTRELANLNIMIAKAITLGESLRDAQYKLASEAELRALEDTVRTAGDSLRQMGYDMKELARQMNGGY